MQGLSRQRGVSLIEVMMAVLIFSIGLIGLAGLMIVATRSNQAGYMRTQVTYLAHNMADRMSANPIGVWSGDYNSASYPVSTTQDCSAACTPAQVAKYDQQMWSSQLRTFLPPGADAKIACAQGAGGYNPVAAGQVDKRPPYGGTCTMSITWSERSAGNSAAQSAPGQTQTFAWEFQP